MTKLSFHQQLQRKYIAYWYTLTKDVYQGYYLVVGLPAMKVHRDLNAHMSSSWYGIELA